MPLDSNLFSDLETAIAWNVAATRSLPRADPDRFSLATPAECWRSVERTWEHAPTSERICQDIERMFESIDVVVTNRGTAVDFEHLRHGRRERDHNDCRSKRRAEKLKKDSDFDFLGCLHPIAIRNINNIIDLTH